tara:strand:+ start:200 stop:982 length:783 start_codon:yes stop_codon:yes gene_type:complete
MDITKKVVIMVTGCHAQPDNHKECERTWVPLLRKMGFRVIIAFGNPKLDEVGVMSPEDFDNYYTFTDENTIQFNTFDSKDGLFDKSIKLPSKWVLEETKYEYYFRIDSDSFVHPERFKQMLEENFQMSPDLDYLGCCFPWCGWNPHHHNRLYICKYGHFGAGCGYMVSRRAMRVALDKMRVLQPSEFQVDDWVLGRAMWENGIPLIHDSRIYFESKYNRIIGDFNGIGVPDISDKDSHLAIQHYMNGHMEDTIKKLKFVI